MSSTDSPTLLFDVRARRAEPCIAYAALGAGALTPWLFPPVSLFWTLYASATLALVLWAGLRRVGWVHSPRRLSSVSWSADGRWRLTCADGRDYEAKLQPATRVFPWGAWLSFQVDDAPLRRCSLLLLRADVRELRRLLVRLRVDGSHVADPVVAP